MLGFEGVSRSAFEADAMLFSVAALVWRGVWAVKSQEGRAARPFFERRPCGSCRDDDAQRNCRQLFQCATAEKPRPQRPQVEMPGLRVRLSGRWSTPPHDRGVPVAFTYILRIRTAGFVFY
jgi:hypothetical protein